MNKISLQELKSMYGGVSGKYRPQSATKPGFAHIVNPTYTTQRHYPKTI